MDTYMRVFKKGHKALYFATEITETQGKRISYGIKDVAGIGTPPPRRR